jgi:hypothetical protein
VSSALSARVVRIGRSIDPLNVFDDRLVDIKLLQIN